MPLQYLTTRHLRFVRQSVWQTAAVVDPTHGLCCASCASCAQVTAAEGFGKTRLFEILDDLEEKTRPIMQQARQRLAKEKGEAALEPHNMGYALAGEAAVCLCVLRYTLAFFTVAKPAMSREECSQLASSTCLQPL